MISKLKLYLQESKKEFGRVNWPTKEETRKMTITVIIVSLAFAAFLGIIDAGFEFLLSKLLNV